MHGILEVHFLKSSRGNMPSNPLEARVLSARRKAAMLLLKPPFLVVSRVGISVPQAPHGK